MQRFAGILFEMQTLDTDRNLRAVWQIDQHNPFPDNRVLVLADLIALRQVGIEIIFAVKHRAQIDGGIEPQSGAHRLFHTFLVDDGQHAGHGRIHQRHMGVLIAAKGRRRA